MANAPRSATNRVRPWSVDEFCVYDDKAPDGFAGTRCVELGSGVGLVGLVMASLGAAVVLTDKHVNASRGNIAKNWLAPNSNRYFLPVPRQCECRV